MFMSTSAMTLRSSTRARQYADGVMPAAAACSARWTFSGAVNRNCTRASSGGASRGGMTARIEDGCTLCGVGTLRYRLRIFNPVVYVIEVANVFAQLNPNYNHHRDPRRKVLWSPRMGPVGVQEAKRRAGQRSVRSSAPNATPLEQEAKRRAPRRCHWRTNPLGFVRQWPSCIATPNSFCHAGYPPFRTSFYRIG